MLILHRKKWIIKIKASISSQIQNPNSKIFEHEIETEEDLHFIAAAIFDALMFAGIINIGNLLWNALSIIYSPDHDVSYLKF